MPRKVLILAADATDFPEINEPPSYPFALPNKSTTINYGDKEIHINVDKLEFIRTIGVGQSGRVELERVHDHPNVQMAVKKMLLHSDHENRLITMNDLKTMEDVKSDNQPYVVKFYGALMNNERELCICMEVMDTSMDKFYPTMHLINKLDLLDQILRRLVHN
ncbi:unnamed protein product, partial [Didymodactylos carnosus]